MDCPLLIALSVFSNVYFLTYNPLINSRKYVTKEYMLYLLMRIYYLN
jgi:hypothetical protein